jgi:hypothetical protein
MRLVGLAGLPRASSEKRNQRPGLHPAAMPNVPYLTMCGNILLLSDCHSRSTLGVVPASKPFLAGRCSA